MGKPRDLNPNVLGSDAPNIKASSERPAPSPSSILAPASPFPLHTAFLLNPLGFPPSSHLTHIARTYAARSLAAMQGVDSPFILATSLALAPCPHPPCTPRQKQHLRQHPTPAQEPPRSGCFRFPQLNGSFKISGKAWI